MLTVHILTKNNSQTIKKTLDSVEWADHILVGDLGSQDETVAICRSAGAEVIKFDRPRDEVRNSLIAKTSGPTLWLEPWEVLIKGQQTLMSLSGPIYVSVLNQNTLVKEIRAWAEPVTVVNPVYETVECEARTSDVMIFSTGRPDYNELLVPIKEWQARNPTAKSPYYYEACTLLALGKWQQFLSVSEHYMFLDKSASMPVTMNHYYFAMVQLMYVKKIRPTLQNLALCLAVKPLMAEFWCLAGDAHYHLAKKFQIAKALYENAIVLGSRRLSTDLWPMDISKYKTYPQKMIESCDKILASKTFYGT